MTSDSGLQVLRVAPAQGPPADVQGQAYLDAMLQAASCMLRPGGLDAAMQDRPAPRLWLVMHRLGQEDLSAQVACALALGCAERGQVVVLVDADEDEGRLTERSGRRHREGWADMGRFGVSLAAAALPLAIPQGRASFVGVGSFTPAEISEEQLQRLLARLRHQADDLILVSSCGAAGRALAPWADLRLLCRDPAADRPEVWELAAREFERAGYPLTALVEIDRPEARQTVPAPAAAPAPEQPTVEPAPAPAPAKPAATAPAPATPAAQERVQAVRVAPRSRRSSGIFWIAAAAAVVLISLVAVYIIGPSTGRDRQGSTPQGRQPAHVQRTPQRSEQPPAQDTVAQPPAQDTAAQPSATEPVQDTAAQPPATGPAQTQAQAQAEPQTPAEPAPLDRQAFALPVGRDGWALHLYSLPDSAGALQMAGQLERRGFSTRIKAADLPSGRWYRVFVGSFPSRAAAAAQVPALLREVKEDWANPVKF